MKQHSILILIGLSLMTLACQPKGNTGNENKEETITIPKLQSIKGFPMGRVTVYDVSSFPASIYGKEIKELKYYDTSNLSEEEKVFEQFGRLYPLGWSNNGKLAYAVYRETYHEEQWLTYTIQDMQSGDTLWQKEYLYNVIADTVGFDEYMTESDLAIILPEASSKSTQFQAIWTIHEKEVVEAMQQNEIPMAPSNDFIAGSNFEGTLFEVESEQTESDDANFIFYLKSAGKAPLLINEIYQFTAPQTEVKGFIKNPSGFTVAVLVSQRQQMFEMSNETIPYLIGIEME